MVSSTWSAIFVALSAIALLILLDALRRTIARAEWDGGALFGALSVMLTVGFVYLIVTYRGQWVLAVANRLETEWIVPEWGRWAIRLANAGLVVASAVVLFRAARRHTTLNPAAVLFLAMTALSSASAAVHGDDPMRAYSLVFLAVVAACTVAPRGLGIHVGIGTFCMIAAIASGFAIVVQKDFSVLPCMGDKCGILGFNFRGIFNHENGLAMFLVLAMPFVYIGFASWQGPLLAAYLLSLVLITGSRSATAAGAITFVALILMRPNIRQPTRAPVRTAVVYSALAVTFLVGLVVPYVYNDPGALNGRVYVWILARDALTDPVTLIAGTGMLGWQHVRDAGLIDFSSTYSVHNQWLHVLYTTGLIGLLLFLAALVVLVRQAGREYGLIVGSVLLPGFLLAATERPWEIDTADWLVWAVPGLLLCYPVRNRLSGDESPETPRTSESAAAQTTSRIVNARTYRLSSGRRGVGEKSTL